MPVPSEPTKKSAGRSSHTRSAPAANGQSRKIPELTEDNQAPPVDEELIGALVRHELSKAEARQVYELIYCCPDWKAVYMRLVLEDYRQSPHD
jgi:hypothetical protein